MSEIAQAINNLTEILTRRIERGDPLAPEEREQIAAAMQIHIETCDFFGMEDDDENSD